MTARFGDATRRTLVEVLPKRLGPAKVDSYDSKTQVVKNLMVGKPLQEPSYKPLVSLRKTAISAG
jgi:hypothetical protein